MHDVAVPETGPNQLVAAEIPQQDLQHSWKGKKAEKKEGIGLRPPILGLAHWSLLTLTGLCFREAGPHWAKTPLINSPRLAREDVTQGMG